MDTVGARGGAGDTGHHSQDPGPDAPAREQDRSPPRHPAYQNRLASGISPLAPPPADHSYDDPAAADIIYGDATYHPRTTWPRASLIGPLLAGPPPIASRIRKTPLGGGWKYTNRGCAPTANDARRQPAVRSVSRHRPGADNAPFPRRAARSFCRTFCPCPACAGPTKGGGDSRLGKTIGRPYYPYRRLRVGSRG